MSKKKKKRPTRSRLYIDPVAVRAALYCKHMSMEHFQKVSGFAPELCETLYHGGKVPLAVVNYLAAFFKWPANDFLLPVGRVAQEEKGYLLEGLEPSAEEALEILNGENYNPYKNDPAPVDRSPVRRIFRAEGYSGAEILEMSKFL